MKRKKINPEQWEFERCVEFTISALGSEDRQALIDGIPFDWHSTLGRWIRNNCGLWKHGTDRCVVGIVQEYNTGRLVNKDLDNNRFTHPGIAFKLENTTSDTVWFSLPTPKNPSGKTSTRVDNSLTHPDNCSSIIIDTIIQRLRDAAN
jgi:hypothetical protein